MSKSSFDRFSSLGSGRSTHFYRSWSWHLLDPEPVDRSVWDALGELLHADVRALAGFRPAPLAAEAAFLRADVDAVSVPPPAAAAPAPATPEEPPDEVDRLFTGAD